MCTYGGAPAPDAAAPTACPCTAGFTCVTEHVSAGVVLTVALDQRTHCAPLPDACAGRASCACMGCACTTYPGGRCSDAADGILCSYALP